MKYLAAMLILLPSIAFGQCALGIKCDATTGLTAGNTQWNSGIVTNGLPQTIATNADYLRAPNVLTITRSPKCKLVVLEDTAEKLVIGCRAELGK